MSTSDSWITAIDTSTNCLRHQNTNDVNPCLDFLQELENQLYQQTVSDEEWSFPPKNRLLGLNWIEFLSLYQVQHGRDHLSSSSLSSSPPPPPVPHMDFSTTGIPNNYNSTNTSTSTTTNTTTTTGSNLDCRRILIRILTCQSECLALKSSSLLGPSEWKEGAETLTRSLEYIHKALDVADTQISKWIMMECIAADVVDVDDNVNDNLNDNASNNNNNGGGNGHLQSHIHSSKQDLMDDADTVEIAIGSLTKRKDKFIKLGKKEEAFLLRKLQPQWAARDEVKQRMGEARWRNNPHRKGNYAEMRRELEMRHRDVHEALMVLENMELNLVIAKNKSMGLKNQLQHGSAPTSMVNDVDENSVNSSMQYRYNGFRPDNNLLEQRVSFQDYPDPTEFGWIFTGSSQVTEFFEKDMIKLDWYFTTATIKTSMEHPKQGKTQMFRKQVDPTMYREILENPRVHTDKGYQRKKNNNRRPQRNFHRNTSS